VIVDERSLSLAGLPVGEYRLVVGLYRPDTGARLPAVDSGGAPLGDSLTLPLSLDIK
jgi:hypothetical protein